MSGNRRQEARPPQDVQLGVDGSLYAPVATQKEPNDDDDTNHLGAKQRRRDASHWSRRFSELARGNERGGRGRDRVGLPADRHRCLLRQRAGSRPTIRASGIDRGELFITTKLWYSDYGYDEALVGFEGCLRRLGVDYIDLFLLHHPVPIDFDATVAAYEAIEKMHSEGRARAIGVSNFSEQHLEGLMQRTEVVPAVNQVELHPFFTQQPLRDFHAKHDTKTEAWSPLGGIQRYRPADPNAVLNALEHPTVTPIAEKYRKTPAQVVLRWHLEHGVVAIPKSVKAHRIKENFDVFDFALTSDEVALIDGLDTGVRGGPDPETLNMTTYPKTVEN